MITSSFWKDKRVFLTGHTGFKGSWLSIWLHQMGALVTGYSLNPPTDPSLFKAAEVEGIVNSIIGDVRDANSLEKAMINANPEIVIHMAAQPLVRESYKNPVETYSTNVMGTVNLFESIRKCSSVRVVINVTTDKCYENKEWVWGYRENEPMGGYDPYSNSKACSELVTSSYRSSFFNQENYSIHGVAVATARAGNVIGGGDWAVDRLIPDCVNSLINSAPIIIRNPDSIRPWQHVLEPLSGYLLLAEKLYKNGPEYAEAWNFGPNDDDARPVEWIVSKMIENWNGQATYQLDTDNQPHEAGYLKLDCSKAKLKLGWKPRWTLETTIEKIVEWVMAYQNGDNVRNICQKQLKEYLVCKVK
ncbi:CDP-glucose 4,6-dehydratase [Robertmurraya kyonggiensis]|uniref:CDP-glucose 4,6-dehydratase n=1 Tax=Robertmurraya kyonggiensis TaxID=1037680 RepID=A0A4U1D7F7_9BACI|nr:CDP-glucose 4,6-dehydratase [Robertmurraya kyonggiensis]TKC16986.1 CDP-glucose 4,6-dehydratase [Robertmurraya kyonggiensis]